MAGKLKLGPLIIGGNELRLFFEIVDDLQKQTGKIFSLSVSRYFEDDFKIIGVPTDYKKIVIEYINSNQ